MMSKALRIVVATVALSTFFALPASAQQEQALIGEVLTCSGLSTDSDDAINFGDQSLTLEALCRISHRTITTRQADGVDEACTSGNAAAKKGCVYAYGGAQAGGHAVIIMNVIEPDLDLAREENIDALIGAGHYFASWTLYHNSAVGFLLAAEVIPVGEQFGSENLEQLQGLAEELRKARDAKQLALDLHRQLISAKDATKRALDLMLDGGASSSAKFAAVAQAESVRDATRTMLQRDWPKLQSILNSMVVIESPQRSDAAEEQRALSRTQSGSVASLSLPFSDIGVPQVIGRLINALLGVTGALALGFFVYGGLLYMTAAGAEERVERAKKTLVWSTLGLIAIFTSYAVVRFIVTALAS